MSDETIDFVKKSKKRIEWVDYIKAFACLLVVIGHLIQSLQKAGIDNYESITSYINWFIYLFHMPLFMCMSGFLYCNKKQPFSWNNYKKFEIKKIINLAIPYFTFYLVYVIVNMLFSSSVNSPKSINDIIAIFNNPISPYWFLYALLSIFIVIPLIEKVLKNNKKSIFVFFVCLKITCIFIQTPIYFFNQIMAYGIYFYFGIFINEIIKNKNIKNIIFNICIYIIMSIIVYCYRKSIDEYIKSFLNIFFAIDGIVICVQVFYNIDKCRWFNKFKKYTFQIFVLHTIFAAGVRIVLLKIGITNYFIHFTFGLLASIYIPVLVSKISNKILYTNFFFFPLRTIEEIQERKI